MKYVVHDKTPETWVPQPGELCWYGQILCIRTDIPFSREGALVNLGSGCTYRAENHPPILPFYGTITASNDEVEA